jgi:hypothetical protein
MPPVSRGAARARQFAPSTGQSIIAGILGGIVANRDRQRQQEVEDRDFALREAQQRRIEDIQRAQLQRQAEADTQADIERRQQAISGPILGDIGREEQLMQAEFEREKIVTPESERKFEQQMAKTEAEQAGATERTRITQAGISGRQDKTKTVAQEEADITREFNAMAARGTIGNMDIEAGTATKPGADRSALARAVEISRGTEDPSTGERRLSTPEAFIQVKAGDWADFSFQDLPGLEEQVESLRASQFADPSLDTSELPIGSGAAMNAATNRRLFQENEQVDLVDLARAMVADGATLEEFEKVVAELFNLQLSPEQTQTLVGEGEFSPVNTGSERFVDVQRRQLAFPEQSQEQRNLQGLARRRSLQGLGAAAPVIGAGVLGARTGARTQR